MLHPLHYNFSDTYSEIPDFTQNMSDRSWRDGLISGNGLIGYVTSGAPYSDTFIFQHMYYNYPDHQPRHIPDELLSH